MENETQHHSTEQDLIHNRIEKLERIRARGDDPFKRKFERSATIAETTHTCIRREQEGLEEDQLPFAATLAGRITALRRHGKSTFADLRDDSGKIQVFFGLKNLGEASYAALDDVDIGDFLGVSGTVKRTRTGEITIFADTYTLLTKSLRPLPEKYHGLTDVETRYRRRYLDLVANPEIKDVFRKRTRLVSALREWLDNRGFLEVETPMLHPIPGGATARPFITYHNTYDRHFYLRIAPELYLKRLIVGGFERVYELNRNFRNEGVDTRHNPEFTMLELYEAYQDYKGLMDETEDLFVFVIQQVLGTLQFTYQGENIDATPPWRRIPLHQAIREYAGIDLESTRDRDEAARLAASIGIEIEPHLNYGKVVDEVMKERVVPHLVAPTFLYDYPIEISPLAKKKADNPALTERFQVFMGRLELCNAFSELNDPIDQRERFMEQMKQREAGDDEAQHLDEDFLRALEVGMPPTAGLGIGVDRFAMLLTDSPSIRDVILFPQLRTIE